MLFLEAESWAVLNGVVLSSHSIKVCVKKVNYLHVVAAEALYQKKFKKMSVRERISLNCPLGGQLVSKIMCVCVRGSL